MQLPQPAPGLDQAFPFGADQERAVFQRIIEAGVTAEVNGRYLHWDELRHRKPPAGLTSEQWWWAVLFARNAIRVPLPFKASIHERFWFARTETLHRALHDLDRRLGTRLELTDPGLANEGVRDIYILRSLAEEAITSSQLEGAATTRAVAKEMLLTQRAPVTQGERMIVNNFRAMSFIRERREEDLTPEFVLELHRLLTEGTLSDDEVGRFRRPEEQGSVQEHATGQILHLPPNAAELPRRLEDLCRFANAEEDDVFIHPVLRSSLMHFILAYDHPFVDGNGRTARALFYWSLLKRGYWLAEFLSISRIIQKAPVKYSRAFLHTESDHADTTYFLLHQVAVLREAIDDLYIYLEGKARAIHQVEKLLKDSSRFNHRQERLLAHALRHPTATYAITDHQREHRIVYQTARTDLLGLVEAGLLSRKKVGKKFLFVPGPEIRKRRM